MAWGSYDESPYRSLKGPTHLETEFATAESDRKMPALTRTPPEEKRFAKRKRHLSSNGTFVWKQHVDLVCSNEHTPKQPVHWTRSMIGCDSHRRTSSLWVFAIAWPTLQLSYRKPKLNSMTWFNIRSANWLKENPPRTNCWPDWYYQKNAKAANYTLTISALRLCYLQKRTDRMDLPAPNAISDIHSIFQRVRIQLRENSTLFFEKGE